MSETYPVLINGEKKGTLTVSREGLTTRFDAKCEDPGTLVRLSVYGGGKEGYLGVMTPENLQRVYGMDVYGWMREMLGQWQ